MAGISLIARCYRRCPSPLACAPPILNPDACYHPWVTRKSPHAPAIYEDVPDASSPALRYRLNRAGKRTHVQLRTWPVKAKHRPITPWLMASANLGEPLSIGKSTYGREASYAVRRVCNAVDRAGIRLGVAWFRGVATGSRGLQASWWRAAQAQLALAAAPKSPPVQDFRIEVGSGGVRLERPRGDLT